MKKSILFFLFLSLLIINTSTAQYNKCHVNGIAVNVSNKATLNIEPNILEDFESYSDFSTTFAPWILNDVDQLNTYGVQDVTFPNSGTAMSYIIFNPNSTTPAMTSAASQAHSGVKFAASFASQPSGSQYNNDWMITPKMQMGTQTSLSFYAKSYTIQWGNEKLNVLVSTTGTDPSNFTKISGSTPISVPDAWTKYEYDLSAYNNQEIHIAFQGVSQDAFILMLDDILVSTEPATDETSLSGIVTDAFNGQPIANANVSIAGNGP